jgi:hypothetical protein
MNEFSGAFSTAFDPTTVVVEPPPGPTSSAPLAVVMSGRRAAGALMRDWCQITHPGEQVTDRRTGHVYAVPDTPVYEGRCKVQSYQPFEQNPEAGAHSYAIQRYAVHVPVGAYVPHVGDVVTILAATMDPNLAGRVFRVVALLHKSYATAYRLAITDEVD